LATPVVSLQTMGSVAPVPLYMWHFCGHVCPRLQYSDHAGMLAEGPGQICEQENLEAFHMEGRLCSGVGPEEPLEPGVMASTTREEETRGLQVQGQPGQR
jgi:hypothetical protein